MEVIAKRNIDLLSYLPNFLREYDETKAALDAENPEFKLLWEQSDEVLRNGFILTADEWGIKKFEKLLGIYPEPWLDLETRREIVLIRWFSRLPYTYRMLLKQLYELCGENFSVSKNFDTDYCLNVHTYVENWIEALEIKRLIIKMIPANIRTDYCSTVRIKPENPSVTHCGAVTSGKKKSIYRTAKKFEVWQRTEASVKMRCGVKTTGRKTERHMITAREV